MGFRIFFALTAKKKFNLFCFKPILDLDVLCSLDSKESYLNWVIELWEPFDKIVKPDNCKNLLFHSGIGASRILDKVCVFKQNRKKYYVNVNKKFNEGKIEESYNLLSIEEADV